VVGRLPLDVVRIDADRLVHRLGELAEVGAIAGTAGCCRLALTDEDRAGRDLVVSWMRDLGLAVTVDAIGNVVAVRPGREDLAPVMTGSHIDTVRTGGRYDGNLGVVAGLEVVETLDRHRVTTRRPLAVAFFTNEEGSRFAPDMMGSLVYAGGMGVAQAHDTVGIDGARVGDELARIGYLGPAPCPGPAPHAFVELHIEQGPVLEQAGARIGVVTGVQGISWTEVSVEGQSNHAGTTPMGLRHDAGYAAAEIAVFVRRLAAELGDPLVGTVGAVDLHPNLVNVVAGRATLTVDLRHTDGDTLAEAGRRLHAHLDELARAEGVAITTRPLARFEPVCFHDDIVDLVERTAKELGHPTMRLPSGAGHDAQMLARVCPATMVFTPSHRGISHNPAEHTDPADLAAGADVLLAVLLQLAEDGP
jgi:N-carbamoyl-L-amino-acid hydrolase